MISDSLCPIISALISVVRRFALLSFATFLFLCVYFFIPLVFALALFFFLLYQWVLLFLVIFQLKKEYVNFKKTLDIS